MRTTNSNTFWTLVQLCKFVDMGTDLEKFHNLPEGTVSVRWSGKGDGVSSKATELFSAGNGLLTPRSGLHYVT